MIATLLVGISLAAAAPLAWQWTEPQGFHIEVSSNTPKGTLYLGAANLEARAFETVLEMDLQCVPTTEKWGWTLDCAIGSFSLSGTAVPGEQDALRQVFHEYEARLAQRHLRVAMSSAGRVREYEVPGLETSNDRERSADEYLRLLLSRPVGLLDVEMPHKGDGTKPWKQGGTPILFTLRCLEGTAGGVSLKRRVTGWEGKVALLESEGEGMVSPGSVMELDGTFMVRMSHASQIRFDATAGMMDAHEFQTSGRLSASSTYSGDDRYLSETGSLTRVKKAP